MAEPLTVPVEPLSTRDLRNILGLLTEDEVGRALGVTGDTIRIWRRQGHGPAYFQFRRNLFYRSADVSQWLIDNTWDPRTDEYVVPRPPELTFENPQFRPLPPKPAKTLRLDRRARDKPPADPEKIIADLDRMVDKLNQSRPPDDQLVIGLDPTP